MGEEGRWSRAMQRGERCEGVEGRLVVCEYGLTVIRVRDLQDSAREIMIIIDTAIALAALSHVRSVEARIRHLLMSITREAGSGTALGLLLARSVKEKATTGQSSHTNNTYYHTRSDRGRVGTATLGAIVICAGALGGSSHNHSMSTRLRRDGLGCRLGLSCRRVTSSGAAARRRRRIAVAKAIYGIKSITTTYK